MNKLRCGSGNNHREPIAHSEFGREPFVGVFGVRRGSEGSRLSGLIIIPCFCICSPFGFLSGVCIVSVTVPFRKFFKLSTF